MAHRRSKGVARIAAIAAASVLALFSLTASPAVAVEPPIEASAIEIRDANGTPVGGALITIATIGSDEQLGPDLYATTDANGTLELDTVPGFDSAGNPYIVWVNANGYTGYWDGTQDLQSTVPITIVTGASTLMTSVPANNPPDASSAGISGTVTDALTGLPLSGVIVTASDDGDGGDNQGASQSGVDGTFYLNFSGGELPSSAAVQFLTPLTSADAPYGYASQFYDDVQDYSGRPENPVPVSPGVTSSGVDAAMMPQGLISGTVTLDGAPLDNAQISAWSIESGAVISSGYSLPDGTYSIPTPVGIYRIQFQQVDANGDIVATLWFHDVSTAQQGTDVTVVTKEATTGIDAAFVTAPTPPPSPTPTPTLAASGGSAGGVLALTVMGVVLAGGGAAVIARDLRRGRVHR